METLQLVIKKLTHDEQKKITGGDDPCLNLHGAHGPCKTNAACPYDMPICEAN